MISTKKMPVSLSYGEFSTKKNEFLVPLFQKGSTSGFIGIKSGEEFPFGAISYIGKEISAKDIFDKIISAGIEIPNRGALIEMLEDYLKKLQSFKIGNIIKIEYLTERNFNLIKVAEKPPRERTSKLP